mmetsp:Transcript_11195/g.22365  ORF Transcript_11195/g.22365 Transcript_11195/m.22365 type:complete len:715 (+) Transcript_11195:84-2228(+)
MRLHLSSQRTSQAVLQAAISHRNTTNYCNRNYILGDRYPQRLSCRKQQQHPRCCCLIPATAEGRSRSSLALLSHSSSSSLQPSHTIIGRNSDFSNKKQTIHPLLTSGHQHRRRRNLTVFSYQSVDMEVTRHNFRETLPIVGEALDACQFYAFDCEMTGLFVSDRNGLAEGKPPAYLHDMEDRYEEILQSSEAFVINQFGLSTFEWNGSSYQARTFNFYTFPRPFEEYQPRFLCEASSLDFLSQHKFDFNKWIHDGIPYMPGSLRDKKLKMIESPQRRNEIVPMAEEDKMLVADLRVMVRTWLLHEDSAELLLAPVNAYQRALQYQELRKDQFGYSDPPGFYTDKVDGENGRAMIKLVRASSEEVAQREKDLLEQRRNAIIEASGFSEVLDLMRISGKPAVGHNYSFDVAYSLHSFVSPLPSSWEEYRKLVQWQFPGGIFDTKLIAKKLFENCSEPIDTSLGSLYNLLTVGDFLSEESRLITEAASVSPRQDLVLHAQGFDKYAHIAPGELAHEAGYDAFMTGTVFACLVAHASDIADSSSSEEEDGQLSSMRFDVIESLAWKMHLTRSDMEYATFSGQEDVPQRQHIIYVRNIPEHLQVRRGNELSRDLGKKGLSGVRVTVLENGLKALIEFQDAETASNVGLPLLTEMYQDADVQEYSAFREDVKAKRDLVINKRKEKSRFRPRPLDTETKNSSSKKQKGEEGLDQGIKCSIM